MTQQVEIIVPPDYAEEAPILGGKLKLFADGILAGKSGTQAAMDAGYSSRSSGVQASQMLKKPAVAEYLRYMRAKLAENTQYSAAEWQKELRGIAHSNVQDFTRLSNDGELVIDFSNASRDQLAAIQSVKTKKRKIYDRQGNVVGEEQDSEFRLWDKLRAAELLGKHAGFLREPEQKVIVDVADRLLNARARVLRDRLGAPSTEQLSE